jgi:hypothetical protein
LLDTALVFREDKRLKVFKLVLIIVTESANESKIDFLKKFLFINGFFQ